MCACYLRKHRDEIVRAIEAPERSVSHGKWYVSGHRWIKSRQKWSGNALVFLLGDTLREVPCPDASSSDDAEYHREQARSAELARRGAANW